MNQLVERRSMWVALTFAFLLGGVGVSAASAQDAGVGERITIMVPDLAPRQGADDDFGKDVSDELRDLIGDLHTHQTVSSGDIKDARRELKLAHEELFECIKARQLAMRKSWGLVLCGEYQEMGGGQVQVDAKFVGSSNGSEFEVPQFTISERDSKQAARTILQTFDRWQTQLRHTVFCQQYMESESWDRALENCNTALEINPGSADALYMKAFIERETDQPQAALETLEQLLDIDPINENALKLAGIVATEATMPVRAREYFDRYMELNPGDVGVRLTIATDIANAGDPGSALLIAQEGAEQVAQDTAVKDMTLTTYIGHFAAQAAGQAETAVFNGGNMVVDPQGNPVDSATVRRYYETAARAYQEVYEVRADSTDPQILERLIIAQFKLGRFNDAVALGESAVALAPENAAMWDAYSRALQEAGRAREALDAMQRTQELGGGSAGLTQRRATLQLQLGNAQQAVASLVAGVEAGEIDPSNAFNIVFRTAYVDNFQKGRLDPAYNLLEAAGPLAQTEQDRLTRNFWRGYIRFEQAKAAHEPMTAASAQRAKPLFERALELFRAAQGYERYHASANVPQLIENAQRFIQIEEALIKRGQ